jgi:hypothetical protein
VTAAHVEAPSYRWAGYAGAVPETWSAAVMFYRRAVIRTVWPQHRGGR